MIKASVAVHIFVAVILVGTGWRILSYHALASSNPMIQHAGAAMQIQY